MKLAIVCSAHGFGHLTRQLAVAEALRAEGVDPAIFTAAPPSIVEATLPSPRLRPWVVDVGIAQRDSLTEDLDETLRRLDEVCSERQIDALAEELGGFDRVVVDTAPAGLEAARRAGVEAIAVGNFEWAWLYGQYPRLRQWAARFEAWQRPHLGLELWPGPGLQAFRSVERFGLVARQREPHALPQGSVLVSFGGFGLADLDARLPEVPGVTWVISPPMTRLERPDVLWVEDVPYPALVAGAELVLTKPGYGILAEAMSTGTPIAYLDRGAFPEAASLVAVLEERGDRRVENLNDLGDLIGQERPRVALATAAVARRLLRVEPVKPS